MNRSEDMRKWLNCQQSKLDEIVACSCEKYWNDRKDSEGFGKNLMRSQQELWKLSDDNDADYGVATIGFSYALWYHLRRVNTFLSLFAGRLIDVLPSKEVTVVDLGAGTGAVKWAVSLVALGLYDSGQKLQGISFIDVDNSGPMLEFNNRLWDEFAREYDVEEFLSGHSLVERDWRSFNASEFQGQQEVFLFAANYLFNTSDNKADVADRLADTVDNGDGTDGQLLCASSRRKKDFLDKTSEQAVSAGYFVHEDKPKGGGMVFAHHGLEHVNDLRKRIRDHYPEFSGHSKFLKGSANWAEWWERSSALWVRRQ